MMLEVQMPETRCAAYQMLFAVIPPKNARCPPCCVVAKTTFLFALQEDHTGGFRVGHIESSR